MRILYKCKIFSKSKFKAKPSKTLYERIYDFICKTI